jgi:hypothetical protein
MATKQFVVTRVGARRLRIVYGELRAECLDDSPAQLRAALAALGLARAGSTVAGQLRAAVDRFLELDRRCAERFGPPRRFRIWRVDADTLQIDFDGGHAEVKPAALDDRALRQCLLELFAAELLLPDLKKEVAAFLKVERSEPLPDALFFRHDGRLHLLVAGRDLHSVPKEAAAAIRRLAKTAGVDADRLAATFDRFREQERQIREAIGN